jgi:hypothetical protein
MEVIKPYKSIIDGKLASKEGDWNFSKPCHWYFSKKLLKPINHNGYIRTYDIKQRNLVNVRSTEEWEFRNGKRRIPSPVPLERFRTRGVKKLEPNYTQPLVHPRHVNHSPHELVLEKPRSLKQFPAKWIRHSFEDDGETKNTINMINRKLITHENQYLYKSVEYEPKYFKQEGWVVGATNTINFKRYAPQNNTTFKSLDLNVKILDSNKFYAVKEGKALADADLGYMNKLNEWDKVNIPKSAKKK